LNKTPNRLAILMLLGAFACRPGAAATPAEEDPLAWERYQNTPDDPIASVDWFTPIVAIGQGAGAAIPVAAEGERSLPDASLDNAQRYAESLNSYALIIAHRGVIQHEYYKEGFGPERLLDSQSLHKPLAAILTMAAVADGLLSLDAPMADFIPAWQDDPRGRITVRDVLYMQTGLSQPRYEDRWDNAALRLFITSRVEDALLALPAESPPGEHFRSHFAATQLLQLVLESATGKRYADFLRERIWQPLGGGEARVRLDRPDGNAQIFCCLQARPRGWLRIGLMLSRHGEYDGEAVLPFDAFMQLTTPSPLAPNFAMQQVWRGSPYSPVRMMDSRNPDFGLPMSAPFAADDVFYLEGRGGQRVYVVPSRELVVVRQGEIRMEWDDAEFLNPLIEAATEPGKKSAFSAWLAPPAPDYSQRDSWARHPGTASDTSRPAAFYINPTTYRGRELWNAPHNAPDVNPGVDEVVLGQASVLDACCDVWAPRYRQASFGALGGGLQAYDLAFIDVRAAFEQFLDEIGERPFVILGHSQGALHTQRLVERVVDPDAALARRLVAAYVVGIPVPEALYATTLSRVTACRAPEQVGCIVTWASYAPDYKGLAQWRQSARERYAPMMAAAGTDAIQCTNPLSWQANETAMPPARNLGATMINKEATALITPVPGLVGARCADGALLVSPRPAEPFTALEFIPGSYHFADVALFHENLSRNLVQRAAAWQER
jgi:CubicO group peptidase (beta-lactamase class C family)/pimeloyl-ACP methyl ester carboxylesterase